MVFEYAILDHKSGNEMYSTYLKRRNQFAIPDNGFVHFDIPLTLEHERELLQNAGFAIEIVLDNPDGATMIAARKGD